MSRMFLSRWRHAIPTRLRGFLHRKEIERELDDEMLDHIEHQTAANITAGMCPDEARRQALAAFGGVERVKDESRDVRWLTTSDGFIRDARHALRVFTRNPGFALVVVVTLALGIGVSATMFGTIDRLMLRPPSHVVQSGHLRRLYASFGAPTGEDRTTSIFPYAAYKLMRDRTHVLDGAAAYASASGTLGQGVKARAIDGTAVTSDFFALLGVHASAGRLFTASEDDTHTPADVVVLSEEFWRREFAGSPAAFGKTIRIYDRPFTIIGVVPAGFTGVDLRPTSFWIPLSTHPAPRDWQTSWMQQWLQVVVRLKTGVDTAVALREVDAALHASDPVDRAQRRVFTAHLSLRPISSDIDGGEPAVYPVARWLSAIALLVLVVACANVANLMLARALYRRRELALRLALGIDRLRLLRLLMAESVALSLVGGMCGMLVAYAGSAFIRQRFLGEVLWDRPPVDLRVVGMSALLAIGAGVLMSILPVAYAYRTDIIDSLKAGHRSSSERHGRVRAGLLIAQAALAMLLLIIAGLFVRSLNNARSLDLGFQPERALSIAIHWPRGTGGYDAWERVRRDVLVLPEIEHVTLNVGSPFGNFYGFGLRVPGRDTMPKLGGPWMSAVSSEYFATLGIPLVSGRGFAANEDAHTEPVIIVNETTARALWPNESALGKCVMSWGDRDAPCARIVGIVHNVNQGALREDPQMQAYIPIGQIALQKYPAWMMNELELIVRPRVKRDAAIAAIREVLARDATSANYVLVSPLEDRIDPLIRPWRIGAELFSAFAVLALLVTATGMYGVVTYVAARRTHEFGIRMALGGRPSHVLSLVIRGNMRFSLIGAGLGLAASLIAERWIEPMLFGESARDPFVIVSVAGSLAIVSILASALPAWRAARTDPLVALRAD